MKMKKIVAMAGIVAIIAVGAGCANEQEKETVKNRETTESQETVEDTKLAEFAGEKYTAEDGSAIYFEEDGTFAWYQSDENHEDNYYSGEYTFYFAEEAVDYIVNDLAQFGVTQDEMEAYFDRNKGDELYNEENFCCMVLNNKLFMMDGQKTESDSMLSYYMGFYADGYFDAANMSTGNYIGFTKN